MYSKFIKLVVLLSLLVCCGLREGFCTVVFFNRVVQWKDPRHTETQSHRAKPQPRGPAESCSFNGDRKRVNQRDRETTVALSRPCNNN